MFMQYGNAIECHFVSSQDELGYSYVNGSPYFSLKKNQLQLKMT